MEHLEHVVRRAGLFRLVLQRISQALRIRPARHQERETEDLKSGNVNGKLFDALTSSSDHSNEKC